MIRIDSVSKQNGHQLVFIEASPALNRGEKIGLVGPDGAGKTTLFRMITGREEADEGVVQSTKAAPRDMFDQDYSDSILSPQSCEIVLARRALAEQGLAR